MQWPLMESYQGKNFWSNACLTPFFSRDAPSMIESSDIDEVVVTNSVPHDTQKSKTHKIKTVDISILLAEAIRRIHNKESMSHLFRNVTMED